MYLKEIEASGFKSFADKLKINLDDNITCIVGPNGSGKSNVVDAVRWVLGEQSVKSLRGDGTMTDVIFSGSKSRNALNVASVTLTFDNADSYLKIPYSDVSIKRRVYRTGENEYFLNGEKCRLKDITNLFMDSGIGKESFNIISQGEVQRILSNSPYDRRVIFEEAAGVLKYKKRKEEAIRKLDRTHDNLERVNDIISELEVQVEPLREQSKKAKEYLENKNLLEQIEVALLVYEIDIMNTNYQIAKNKIEKLTEKVLILRNQTSDVRVDSSKVELIKLEEELGTFQQELLKLTKDEEYLNGEKKLLKERSNYEANDSKVHDNISLLTEIKFKHENSLAILETELGVLQQELLSFSNYMKEEEFTITSFKSKKETILKEKYLKERGKIELEHRIDILSNHIENGGGLSQAVKSVLNHPKLTGVHQVIGNLFKVDELYIKAIEVALGGSKHFLVVENEHVATNAINYLKENKLGRATFFPLSIIKPKGIDYDTQELLKDEEGFIDIASSLISYDQKFRSIMLNQLGNILVVRDIDVANRLSKRIHERYRIVTLQGEIIHVGGSITGGTFSNERSIITDKLELSKLQRSLVEEIRIIEELNISFSAIEQKVVLEEEKHYLKKSELFRLQESINNKKQSYKVKCEELDNAIKDLDSFAHVVDSSLSKEEERIMSSYYETVKKKEEILIYLKQKNREKELLQARIEELEAKSRLSHTELRAAENSLKDEEIAVSRMDVQLDHHLQVLSEDYELTYEKAKDIYILELDPLLAKEKVTLYKSNMRHLGMVNLASIEEFERVNTRYEFLFSQRNDLLGAKDTLLEIISEMDEVMKEEFATTFALIEKEFKEVFRQLFNGGSASLKLTDPNNLLETGVEIIASPPGKKLTTISLLSGGEKTLTAISLLFAILNVRVVPFCLFDEVEAALDEANVDRFGKYLDHYKNRTQFLLITHKKKTMEYAKTLYGITMQESGVSKLVSVKFDDEKKSSTI